MKKNKKKIFLVISLILVLIVLAFSLSFTLVSCSGNVPSELNSTSIINQIFPNIWVLVAQLLACAILFLIIFFLVWKPTNKMLERRQQLIRDKIDDAHKLQQSAHQELKESIAKAKQILEESMVESKKIKEEMILSAKQESDLIKQQTLLDLKQEDEKIRHKTQSDIYDAVFKTTETLLQRSVDKKDNDRLVKDFIKDFMADDKQ